LVIVNATIAEEEACIPAKREGIANMRENPGKAAWRE
jgi:hypothetical protein